MTRTVFATLAALALAAPATAQDLKYVEVTRLELGGAMGAMMRMMPGMDDTVEETVYIKGSQMRRDEEGSSTITDWSTGDMLILNHMDRTYVRINFREMAEQMAGAMQEGMAEAADEAEQADREMNVTARLDVDRTGRNERIAGYRAQQMLVTLEIEGEAPPEDPDNPMSGGALAVVTELWTSTDFPEWTMTEAMREEMAEQFEDMGQEMGGSMAGLAAMDPRMSEAMKKNAEALSKIEGTPVRTVVNFVTVPPELDLDTDWVLEQEDISSSGAGQSIEQAARDALGGRLGGMFGRGRQQQEPEEPEPTLSIFMRTITEITDVDTGRLDASLFQAPAGYTEIRGEMPIGAR